MPTDVFRYHKNELVIMAVKIRLSRRGRKKLAIYDVVVADARAPRDGRSIERLGQYNPNTNPATIDINEDKALDWVMKGAQPTDTVRAILSYRGVMFRKHLQVGVNKGAITQEVADQRFQEWQEQKEEKVQGKRDSLAQKRADEQKARQEAESKVKEARTQERLEKQKELEAQAIAAAKEAAGEEAEADEAAAEQSEATEEVAEAPVEETPAAATPEAEVPSPAEARAEAKPPAEPATAQEVETTEDAPDTKLEAAAEEGRNR